MKSGVALMFAAAMLAASAAAHDDTDHKSKYGGVVAVVKDVQYELVAKPDSVTLFIEDHDKKVDTKGGTAKLTLLTGTDKTEITLAPVGANGLEAKGAFKVPAGTKAVATVTLVGKPAVSVRFELK